MSSRIVLPWPASALSPNARRDRRAATAARAGMREAGFYLARQASLRVAPDARLVLTFCPPDRRRRDLDNMLAALKPALDGIAHATCGDDAGWAFTLKRGAPVPGGAVVVDVLPSGTWQPIGALAAGMLRGEA